MSLSLKTPGLALLAAAIGLPAISSSTAQAQSIVCPTSADAVFQVPSQAVLSAYQPGDVLCAMPASPYRGNTSSSFAGTHNKRRVIYVSTTGTGSRTAVSGTLVTPSGTPAETLVAWDPGTFGLADKCAPSATIDTFLLGISNFPTQGRVNVLLQQTGWAAAVVDYQGIGTSEEHPYLDGISAGRATLDLLRAAQRLPNSGIKPAPNLFITGVSQGGNAAVWAAELQPSYASELNLRGVFAAAAPAKPIYALRSLTQRTATGGKQLHDATYDWDSWSGSFSIGVSLSPFGLAGISTITGLDAFYGLDTSSDAARRWKESAQNNCAAAQALSWSFTKPSKYWQPPSWFFDRDNPELSVLGLAMERLNAGKSAPRVPVVLIHGDQDDVVPMALSTGLLQDWCRINPASKVFFHPIAGGSHTDDKGQFDPAMVGWFKSIVSNGTAPVQYPYGTVPRAACTF